MTLFKYSILRLSWVSFLIAIYPKKLPPPNYFSLAVVAADYTNGDGPNPLEARLPYSYYYWIYLALSVFFLIN